MKKQVRTTEESAYWVLAFYHIGSIDDPYAEVARQKEILNSLDATCRLYVSFTGLNGQLCISATDAPKYIDWLHSRSEFKNVHVKTQGVDCHVFPRCTVKFKKELVALGVDVTLDKRGSYLSPQEWEALLNGPSEERIVIDTRNEYEWKVGHFEGAELLKYETFKEFQEYAKSLKDRLQAQDTKKKVLMYCTGGIRCELYSALLKEEGIEDVFQLQGGIIHYGQVAGSKHWKGSLFVFDDRLTVPVSEESTEVIGKCCHCNQPVETYYNCANMDCNELFLACSGCLEKYAGCCKEACTYAPRVRPFSFAHTPFRRWYNYAKTKEELKQLNPLNRVPDQTKVLDQEQSE